MEINRKTISRKSDEWRATLYNGGSVTCVIRKKYVNKFHRLMLRNNKLVKFETKKGWLWEKLICNLYMFYVGVTRFYIGAKYEELDVPIFVYETSWQFIKKVQPITIDNDMVQIVFYGKENNIS